MHIVLFLLTVQWTADFKCIITQIEIELPPVVSAVEERDVNERKRQTEGLTGAGHPRKVPLRKCVTWGVKLELVKSKLTQRYSGKRD